jgi:hypothetical protein
MNAGSSSTPDGVVHYSQYVNHHFMHIDDTPPYFSKLKNSQREYKGHHVGGTHKLGFRAVRHGYYTHSFSNAIVDH